MSQVKATNFNGLAFKGGTKMYLASTQGCRATSTRCRRARSRSRSAPSTGARRSPTTRARRCKRATSPGTARRFRGHRQEPQRLALYAEALIPIVKTVDLNLAVRFDDYSDIGNTTNPKATIRWQPNNQFLGRASYSTGFLAPSQQLFLGQREGVTAAGTDDPLRCPTTNDTRDRNTQFNVLNGGNPDLKPEESESWTLGFVSSRCRGPRSSSTTSTSR